MLTSPKIRAELEKAGWHECGQVDGAEWWFKGEDNHCEYGTLATVRVKGDNVWGKGPAELIAEFYRIVKEETDG